MPKISHESDISYQIKLLYAVYTLYTLHDVFVEKKYVWLNYSLFHRTMKTKDNFWNVYCFMTNAMWDKIVIGRECHSNKIINYSWTKLSYLFLFLFILSMD